MMINSVSFFFNATSTTEIYTLSYTLSLHDALPISRLAHANPESLTPRDFLLAIARRSEEHTSALPSHSETSYAVFCLKKNKTTGKMQPPPSGKSDYHSTIPSARR